MIWQSVCGTQWLKPWLIHNVCPIPTRFVRNTVFYWLFDRCMLLERILMFTFVKGGKTLCLSYLFIKTNKKTQADILLVPHQNTEKCTFLIRHQGIVKLLCNVGQLGRVYYECIAMVISGLSVMSCNFLWMSYFFLKVLLVLTRRI